MTNQMIPAEAVEAALSAIFPKGPVSDFSRATWTTTLQTALEAAAPYMMAAAWEDAYTLGYADGHAGVGPERKNPHEEAPANVSEHGLARTQVSPPVCVWCTCGLQFDAFGDQGAMNKLNDHILRQANRK